MNMLIIGGRYWLTFFIEFHSFLSFKFVFCFSSNTIESTNLSFIQHAAIIQFKSRNLRDFFNVFFFFFSITELVKDETNQQ